MPIETVKTVNFSCCLSFHSIVLELVIVQLYLYAALVSDIDLCFSLACIGLLFQIKHEASLLKPQCIGNISFSDTGNWFEQDQHLLLRSISTVFSFWFLLITFSDKKVKILWRDSCEDSVYRYIIVKEKQRRYTSVLTSK